MGLNCLNKICQSYDIGSFTYFKINKLLKNKKLSKKNPSPYVAIRRGIIFNYVVPIKEVAR